MREREDTREGRRRVGVRGGAGVSKDATLMLVGVSNLLERIRNAREEVVRERKFRKDGDLGKKGTACASSASSTMEEERGSRGGRSGARRRGRLARFSAEFRGVKTSPFGKQ